MRLYVPGPERKIIDAGAFTFTMRTGNTEDLNQAALRGEPDICALSVFAYDWFPPVFAFSSHGSVGRT
jgi:hypothetical protein